VVDSRLVAKRLAVTRRTLVAAPGYLERAGTPSSIDELQRHHGILYSNRSADWRFASAGGWTVVRPRSCMRVNNGLIMRDAALAGHGITLLPTFFTYQDLAAGTLKQVDIGMEAEGAELFVCYPLAPTPSAKVLALVESLRAAFGDPPYWQRSP
jgi:DNA-binding transcriptional LysR family regulator